MRSIFLVDVSVFSIIVHKTLFCFYLFYGFCREIADLNFKTGLNLVLAVMTNDIKVIEEKFAVGLFSYVAKFTNVKLHLVLVL